MKPNLPKTLLRRLDKWTKLLAISIGLLLVGTGALVYRTTHPMLGSYIATVPTENAQIERPAPTLMEVHIAGWVKYPGVYRVAEGTRVREALGMAGGVLPGADLDTVKLSAKVKDGQKIHVKPQPGIRVGKPEHVAKTAPEEIVDTTYPVNINTATASELASALHLSGSLSKRIVVYRELIHGFIGVDQLRSVKGMGEKTFEKIRGLVRV